MYEAFSRASRQTVALKIVASSDDTAWNEVDILRHVASCPHIVHLHAAYVFDGTLSAARLLGTGEKAFFFPFFARVFLFFVFFFRFFRFANRRERSQGTCGWRSSWP